MVEQPKIFDTYFLLSPIAHVKGAKTAPKLGERIILVTLAIRLAHGAVWLSSSQVSEETEANCMCSGRIAERFPPFLSALCNLRAMPPSYAYSNVIRCAKTGLLTDRV